MFVIKPGIFLDILSSSIALKKASYIAYTITMFTCLLDSVVQTFCANPETVHLMCELRNGTSDEQTRNWHVRCAHKKTARQMCAPENGTSDVRTRKRLDRCAHPETVRQMSKSGNGTSYVRTQKQHVRCANLETACQMCEHGNNTSEKSCFAYVARK